MNEIIIWDQSLSIANATAEAIDKKMELMKSAIAITEIESRMDLDIAVQQQKEIKAHITAVENRRTELVRPHVDANTAINKLAKEYVATLVEQHNRIQKLGGDFLEKEKRDQEAAEAIRRAQAQAIVDEAARIEREKKEADDKAKREADRLELERRESLAKAQSEAERVQAAKDFEIQAAALKIQNEKKQRELSLQDDANAARIPPAEIVKKAAPRPEGLVERGEWVMTVVSLEEVYKEHPELVRLELNQAEANKSMKAGLRNCRGATIKWEVTMGTRK